MTLLWNVPRVWDNNEAITKEKLNEISNTLTYLTNPSYGLATVRGGTNFTITSTTPVTIDATNYTISVELTGARPVAIELQGTFFNNTLAAISRFDVLIDNVTYLSSLTGTNLASGVCFDNQKVASAQQPLHMRLVVPAGVLSAGVHTLVPMGWVTSGTLTWVEGGCSQFYAGEF